MKTEVPRIEFTGEISTGEKVRISRLVMKLSQAAVAKEIGVLQSQVSAIEADTWCNPEAQTKILSYFDINENTHGDATK